MRKHLPRMFSIDQERKLGDQRRSDTVLVLTINDSDYGLGELFNSLSTLWEIISLWVPGEVWTQVWNLKELTEGHTRSGACGLIWLNTGKLTRARHGWDWQKWELFLDSMGGGAWPFLVGGVICLVNSVNERDLNLLNRSRIFNLVSFLEGLCAKHMEVWGNNRSVMPLDVLGRTCATMIQATSISCSDKSSGNLHSLYRAWDCPL